MVRKDLGVLALAGSLVLSPIAADVHAGGGMSGGALEVTQLANKAELIAQVAEAASQTAQQVQMVMMMVHNLKQMDPFAIAAMLSNGSLGALGKSIGSAINMGAEAQAIFGALQKVGQSAQKLAGTAWGAYHTMRPVLQGVKGWSGKYSFSNGYYSYGGMKLKPYDFYGKVLQEVFDGMDAKTRSSLTFEGGEIKSAHEYMKVLDTRFKGVEEDMQALSSASESIPSEITGNIQGLQYIAAQQVNTQAAIKELRSTMYEIEGMRKTDEAEKATREKAREELRDMVIRRQMEQFRLSPWGEDWKPRGY